MEAVKVAFEFAWEHTFAVFVAVNLVCELLPDQQELLRDTIHVLIYNTPECFEAMDLLLSTGDEISWHGLG